MTGDTRYELGNHFLGRVGGTCIRRRGSHRLFFPALLFARRRGRTRRGHVQLAPGGSGRGLRRGLVAQHGRVASRSPQPPVVARFRGVRRTPWDYGREGGGYGGDRSRREGDGARGKRGVLDRSLPPPRREDRARHQGEGPRYRRAYRAGGHRAYQGGKIVTGLIVLGILALVVFLVAARSIRIIPQSRVAIIQRLGRYHRTAESGLTVVVPVVDKMLPKTDLREQVIAFQPQAVITNDNVGMQISTVVYYQVVDARASEYEVANFGVALEQITQTTLRNVIGNLILDKTLTSRDEINAKLRTVLDEVTEKWGIRVTRVELKEIIPPRDIQQAMEKQMQAERTRRASILTAEGDKRSAILKAEGEKESSILRAEGDQRSAVLRAEGEAEAYRNVQAAQIEMTGKLFERLEGSDLSPESLRYLYLKALPEMAQGPASKLFVVPSEIQDLAGTLGALAGGAALAAEDGAKGESKQRRLDAPGDRPNGELPARRENPL